MAWELATLAYENEIRLGFGAYSSELEDERNWSKVGNKLKSTLVQAYWMLATGHLFEPLLSEIQNQCDT
jgi:hypothetical protein